MRWIWAASAVVVAIAGCSSAPAQPSASGPVPTTAAPPAAAPTGLGADPPPGARRASPRPRSTSRARCTRRPAGRCRCGPACRARGWRRGRPTARCSSRGRATARSSGWRQPRAAAAAPTTLVDGLTQPHGLAFDGTTLYVAESDRIDAYTYRDGGVGERRVVVAGLPDAKSPELRGAVRARAQERRRRPGRRALLLDRLDRQHLRRGPRRRRRSAPRSCGSRPAAARREVFARGVRNGTGLAVAPDGAVWTAVNNRDNIDYPFDRRLRRRRRRRPRRGDAGLRQRPPARAAGPAHARPRPRLAVLQPRPGRRRPARRAPRSATPTGRSSATSRPTPDGAKLDCAALPPVEQGLGAHSAPLGLSFATAGAAGALRPGRAGRRARLVEPARRPGRRRCRSSRGATGRSAPQQTLVGGFQAGDG